MSSTEAARIPVIIDTDPGVDDALALLLALASPEIEIVAIILSFGNTDVDASYLNIFRIYRVVARHIDQFPQDKERFPNFPTDPSKRPLLIRGASTPLEGKLHSAHYFHGRDGLSDISHRHPECDDGADLEEEGRRFFRETPNRNFADTVLDIIREHPERSLTYIALGPLTNLAFVVRRDAHIFNTRIGKVVCMGGALDVPGNTSPVAEFNFFADPFAVHELLTPSGTGAGLPLDRFILLPLDVTTPHELPFPVYRERVDLSFESTRKPSNPAEKPPLQHFTSCFLERTREIMCDFGKDAMELHDPAAVWFAIANPDSSETPICAKGWRAIRRRFAVEKTGELTRGMLVVDRRSDPGAYAPGANRALVQAALATQHVGEWESTAVPAQVEVAEKGQAASISGLVVGDVKGARVDAGVLCVVETPGPRVILQLLLKRIWGAEL